MKPSRLSSVKICLLAGLFAVNTLMLGSIACDYKKDKITQIEELMKRKKPAYEVYGRNIEYLDFSKISEDSIPSKKVPLASDLEDYVNSKWNNPVIKDFKKFEQDFWEEALKLGYSADKLNGMGVKDSIKAVADIVASRFTYEEVDDEENWFNKKYGSHLPLEEYFHHKIGDCDKYRDAMITSFKIVQELNPGLKNIYLARQELGGVDGINHAWVAIVLPFDDKLVLSHVDPTFYDNNGEFEAVKDKSDAHVWVSNDAFKGFFYHTLNDYRHAYDLFKESASKTENENMLESLLKQTGFTVNMLACYEKATDEIEWVRQQYESKGFTESLDHILYYSYKAHLDAKSLEKAEFYKQRLFKERPNSYWIKQIVKGDKQP
ncbi:MAG: hypothetical protein Q8N77_02375 [Nanoarchaeota archaeon]|nr:hypothetical protein [Nanoarchaeota archaeon]